MSWQLFLLTTNSSTVRLVPCVVSRGQLTTNHMVGFSLHRIFPTPFQLRQAEDQQKFHSGFCMLIARPAVVRLRHTVECLERLLDIVMLVFCRDLFPTSA